jgi:hypothetical protein
VAVTTAAAVMARVVTAEKPEEKMAASREVLAAVVAPRVGGLREAAVALAVAAAPRPAGAVVAMVRVSPPPRACAG